MYTALCDERFTFWFRPNLFFLLHPTITKKPDYLISFTWGEEWLLSWIEKFAFFHSRSIPFNNPNINAIHKSTFFFIKKWILWQRIFGRGVILESKLINFCMSVKFISPFLILFSFELHLPDFKHLGCSSLGKRQAVYFYSSFSSSLWVKCNSAKLLPLQTFLSITCHAFLWSSI